MFGLLPVFAAIVAVPVGCCAYSAARWWHARRRLERAFRLGRERRLNPQTWRT